MHSDACLLPLLSHTDCVIEPDAGYRDFRRPLLWRQIIWEAQGESHRWAEWPLVPKQFVLHQGNDFARRWANR